MKYEIIAWVLKFSDQPYRRISRTLCRKLCAFSKFQPAASPVLSGRLDFNIPTALLRCSEASRGQMPPGQSGVARYSI